MRSQLRLVVVINGVLLLPPLPIISEALVMVLLHLVDLVDLEKTLVPEVAVV